MSQTSCLKNSEFSDRPWISVVITTYDLSRYPEFRECVDSVLQQSYNKYDIVIVTETEEHYRAVTRDYGSVDCVSIEHLVENQNLATARNSGAHAASGDVVAFIDDDATACEDWLAHIGEGYQKSGLDAVGGSAVPYWMTTRTWYLPDEFLFLVGATHTGFADGEGEVRNTFGCNISFKRDVFLDMGGFNTNLGKDHGHNLQSEETELCTRLRAETGNGVYYTPDAKVWHKVYSEQSSFGWLLNRAYWQGYSKAVVGESAEDAIDEEWGFLSHILLRSVPKYIRKSTTSHIPFVQLVSLILFTCVVGVGFLLGKINNYR